MCQLGLRRPSAVKREADAGHCDDLDWEVLIRQAQEQGKQHRLLVPRLIRAAVRSPAPYAGGRAAFG